MKAFRMIHIIALPVIISILCCGCGKKAPPTLGEENADLRVKDLQARWSGEDMVLEGTPARPEQLQKDRSGIKACRVYHSRYSLQNAPCEKCPIEYHMSEDVEASITKEGNFLCRQESVKEKGVHFFKVRLVDEEDSLGPDSERVKVVVPHSSP